MSSAAEARFRVQAPNSAPRSIKVIALDLAGDDVIRRLAAEGWTHTTLLTAAPRDDNDATAHVDPELTDIAGRATTIKGEVDSADLVVMVAGPGGHAGAASSIGQACSNRRVMTTGFVVGGSSASEHDMAQTLAQLRPWSLMLVIAATDDYIDDMMTALRAS